MNQETIIEKMSNRPFDPFIVVTNAGDRYEVRHPEMIKLGRRRLYVFQPVDESGWIQEPVIVGLQNISAIEPVSGEAA